MITLQMALAFLNCVVNIDVDLRGTGSEYHTRIELAHNVLLLLALVLWIIMLVFIYGIGGSHCDKH
jgi:hypothetical protein